MTQTFPCMLLVVSFASLGLAGCFAPGAETGDAPLDAAALFALLSQPVHEGLIAEHAPIESFDGVTLDAFVFRPDADEPVPVIINFSPYWSNLAPPAAEQGDAFSRYLIEYFVPRGYAVALVSARGTGLSEGCFTIGGPTELRDEDAVATFFGTQPWSNGNVTATGKSYDGTMAQGLLAMANPHVKTIVPVAPISELYKYNHYYGVQYQNGLLFNTFNTEYVLGTSLSQPASTYRPGVPDPMHPTYEKTSTRFCDESVDVQVNQYHSVLTGDYTAYWQARNYSALLPDTVEASVLYIHGLQDWNVKPDHMVPWIEELLARDATVKMMLGQWAHDYPHRDDFNLTMLRWLDHFLKGRDTGILLEPLAQVQDTEGLWRHESEWPPARAERRILHTSADGTLGDEAGTGGFSYRDAPVPVATANAFEITFEEGARIVGAPVLHARVAASGARATLAATLYVDGEIVDEGALDLAHRDGLETSQPMQPATGYDVIVPLFPQDLVIPRGGTLRLEIGHTSAGPADFLPWPTGAEVTVFHGPNTFLELPLVALDDVTPEARQPEDVGCWAC